MGLLGMPLWNARLMKSLTHESSLEVRSTAHADCTCGSELISQSTRCWQLSTRTVRSLAKREVTTPSLDPLVPRFPVFCTRSLSEAFQFAKINHLCLASALFVCWTPTRMNNLDTNN